MADAEVNVVASLVADVNDFIKKFQSDVPSSVQNGMETAQKAVNAAATSLTNELNTVAERSREAGQKAGESFSSGFEKAGLTSKQNFKNVSEGAKEAGEEAGAKVNEGLHKKGEEAGKEGENAGKNFVEGLKLIVAAVSLEFLDKIREAIGEAAEFAEDLKNQANETGDSIATVQRLGYAFTSVGVSSDEATRSIINMNRRVQEASQAKTGNSIFERAGLDVAKMATQTGSQNIEMLADRLRELKTPAEQDTFAMEAFGISGKKMLPALLEGGEGIKELAKSADAAGAVLDDVSQEKLERLKTAMNQLAATSRVFYASFVTPFAAAITALNRMLQSLEAAMSHLSQNDKVAIVFGAITSAILLAENVIAKFKPFLTSIIGDEIYEGLEKWLSVFVDFLPWIGVFAALWVNNFGHIREAIVTVWNSAVAFAQNGIAKLQQVYQQFSAAVSPIMAKLSAEFGTLFADVAGLISAILRWKLIWDLLGAVLRFVGGVIVQFLTDVEHVVWVFAQWRVAIGYVLDACANLNHAIGDLDAAIGRLVEHIPLIGPAMKKQFDESAAAAYAMANVLHGLANAVRKPPPEHVWKAPETEKKERHTGDISLAGKEKKDTSNQDALDVLKDNLFPLQEAIRQTNVWIEELKLAMDSLGKIDSPAKLAAQQVLYNKEMAATALLIKQQAALEAQDLRNRNAAYALAANTDDRKEKRKDIEAGRSYQKDADDAHNKKTQDAVQLEKLRQEEIAKTVDYYKSIASDSDVSFLQRKIALNNELWEVMRKQGATAADLAKIEKASLDLLAEQQKQNFDLTNSQDNIRIARNKATTAVRDSESPGKGGGADRAVLDAQAEMTNAAYMAARAAQDLANTQQQLTAAQKSHLASDSQIVTLQTELNAKTAAQITADADLTVATNKLKEAQEATSPAVTTVRQGLLAMAQQVAGPVVDALKMMAQGVNPLVSIFLSLFEKSKSFNDIMVILGKIIGQVARIFDALRPVVDLLLGVLVGVVNVFLTMYNVVVTLLNVLGLHIEKIKLVTASLDDQNAAAVPLLQITHDLPTMNEINAGKSADLIAKQSAIQNDMNTGFAAGLSKIGEIAGTLIGIFALIKVLAAYQATKGAGGILGTIKSLLHLGGSSSSSSGGYDGSALDGGSSADSSGANNYGFGSGTGVVSSDPADVPLTSDGSSVAVDYNTGSNLDSAFTNQEIDASTGGTDNFSAQDITDLGGSSSSGSSGGSGLGGGMADTGAAFGGNLLGGLLSKAIGGNSTDASALGGLGGTVGAIFGGPLGAAIGSFAGELIGGFFGPHPTANNAPDQVGASINGEAYGQAIANLQGSAVTAGGQTYQNQNDILTKISTYIANGGKGLSASLLKEFTGATGIVGGKGGILDLANGVNEQWQTLVNDANTAMDAITAAGGNTASTMQSLLGGATSVDLAALFGNGTSVTSAGGYSVASGGNSTLNNGTTAASTASSFVVNVATINGTDATAVKAMFQPVMDEYARQQAIAARTQATMVGRDAF